MNTVITKYLGPSNYRGARVRAKFAVGGGAATVYWNYQKSGYENHKAALLALLRRNDINPAGLGAVCGDWPGGYVWIVGSQYTVERVEV